MRNRIASKSAHNGLGILNLAIQDSVNKLGQRNEVHVEKLVLVRTSLIKLKMRRHVDANQLVCKTGRRGNRREITHATGDKASLLAQFTLGALKWVITRIELASGNLDSNAIEGRSILANERDLARIGKSNNGGSARMAHDITTGPAPIGELDLQTVHIDDTAVPCAFLRKNMLVQGGVAGSSSPKTSDSSSGSISSTIVALFEISSAIVCVCPPWLVMRPMRCDP